MSTQRTHLLRAPVLLLSLLGTAACGDDRPETDGRETGVAATEPAVRCGLPVFAEPTAAPFEWVRVEGVADGFLPVAAEVVAGGDTLLTPLGTRADGSLSMRVPVHPSFRVEGGEVSVRIFADRSRSCEPAAFTVAPLPPSPGAMATATRQLRAAIDAMVGPGSSDGLTAGLAESGAPFPLLAVPALWALPELEALESLMAADAVAADSPDDEAMLDALAGHLGLAARMEELHQLVLVTRELTGDLLVPPGPDHLSREPDPAALSVSDASVGSALTAFVGLGRRLLTLRPRSSPLPTHPAALADACPTGRDNLFDITEPAELDNLMRAQDYAARFLGGANDAPGGSASGTVFGDIGVLMSWMELLGKHAEAAGKVWSAFSEVVLNAAEAYTGLLPGEMELEVVAAPTSFEEDSEVTGYWTARAVARSDGIKLTGKILDKIVDKALEMGLADASIGKPLKDELGAAVPDRVLDDLTGSEAVYFKELGDRLADRVDSQSRKATSSALKQLLTRIGAKEAADGWDIPGGCWSLPDMSASDRPDDDAPPLVTVHLTGRAIEFIDAEAEVPRRYRPAAVGHSRLEVRTAEGYRKAVEVPLKLGGATVASTDIATTYAFGGEQRVGATHVQVLAIEVDVAPSIKKIEPGDRVNFEAFVRNAVDTRVRWTPSAGEFDEIIDHGNGRHAAVFFSPLDPALYPVTIEVESVSRLGLRASGQPRRRGIARLQIDDPVMDIQQAGGCLTVEGERQFTANVLGVAPQEVDWRSSGPSGNAIDAAGVFRPTSNGTHTIRATWATDTTVFAEVDVEVVDNCCWFAATVSAGPYAGSYAGPALLLGNAMRLRDATSDWWAMVEVGGETAGQAGRAGWRGISAQEGEYPVEMEVLMAKVPLEGPKWGNKTPPDTAVFSAGASAGPSSSASMRITRVEGEPGRGGARTGFIEGAVSGHLGWRPGETGYEYVESEAYFRAIPSTPAEWRADSQYTQCLNAWGMETPYQRAKQAQPGGP